jgi:hypothetical protein
MEVVMSTTDIPPGTHNPGPVVLESELIRKVAATLARKPAANEPVFLVN